MYLHSKHGFVEADAWDGTPMALPEHQSEVEAVASVTGTVIVVRSRRNDTIAELIRNLPRAHGGGVVPQIKIYESPAGWDYEWRAYLTPIEWGGCMTSVAMELDYRNFKHTMQAHTPREYPLAKAIWQAAHTHVERERFSVTARDRDEADRRFEWQPGDVAGPGVAVEDVCDRCGQATWRERAKGRPLHCDDCCDAVSHGAPE